MQKFFFSLIALFFISLLTYGQTTYYVSSSGGNDSNSGTSSSSPWKTLSKLNSTAFKAGDKILFKKGDIWREQLQISSSGTSSSRIELNSYGTGVDPIISGANVVTGFAKYSTYVYKAAVSGAPQQVFFNGIRGSKQSSLSAVTTSNEWYYSSGYLYVYSSAAPGSSVQRTIRSYGIVISGNYVTVNNLQIEKVTDSGIQVNSSSVGALINGCTFYQWSVTTNSSNGAVDLFGSYGEVSNSTLGKKTGSDLSDQGWAGYVGIVINGKQNTVSNNKIYHTAIENESSAGAMGFGVNVINASGVTKIYGNYIYHVGAHGIFVGSNTRSGDEIRVYENTIEYTGLAGISAYKTRGSDGVGGKGYIYKNEVSHANRLGGDVGSNGQQASGIHFNDGVRSGTSSSNPYMKWYCYENKIHDNQSLKVPKSPDSNGISIDYNANNVELYRNIIYNNYGKGMEIWNANNCKIYYNLVYGNDCGTSVSALSGGVESAANNQIYNNTYYKNYNGPDKGTNLNSELWFGMNSKNNLFKNNILYAHSSGYAYTYNMTNTTGNIVDYNVIYTEGTYIGLDGAYGKQTFSVWKTKHSTWDRSSINQNPQLTNSLGGDFSLKSTSPAIDKGLVVGLVNDLLGLLLNGKPDIGALEYGATGSGTTTDPAPPAGSTVILLNAKDAALSSSGAFLGSMTGSTNSQIVYFTSGSGSALFKVKIPETGRWYAWARMYYMSSGSKNSFYVTALGTKHILGDNNSKYDQWHWDGYQNARIDLGNMSAGINNISVSGRETGLTLWVDQVVLTNNPDFVPTDDNVKNVNNAPVTSASTIILNAMSGTLTGGGGLGSMTGSNNTSTVYFTSKDGGVTLNVNIPKTATYYVWTRMYAMSSGAKNSFYLYVNDVNYIIGNSSNKYDQWYWDGYKGVKINVGTLNAGSNTIRISGRQPGTTLWVDQVLITSDASYDPNDVLGKSAEQEKKETEQVIPAEFQLSQNYPNPFNPVTNIKYAVPANAHITVKVYDILGAEVKTLVDEIKAPGYYEIRFDAAGLASGIYIYQIRSNNFVQTKKMNLLK